MAKLQCIATCYMDTGKGYKDRYEDYYGDKRDVYDVPDELVDEYLASGMFVRP